MLFLQHPADGSAEEPAGRMPVADAAGLYLERALLASDSATRLQQVAQALAVEPNLATWAIASAEMHSCRTVNRIEDAATWLSENLVMELAGSLRGDAADSSSGSL